MNETHTSMMLGTMPIPIIIVVSINLLTDTMPCSPAILVGL